MGMQINAGNRISNPYAAFIQKRQTCETMSPNNDLRAKIRMLSNDRQSVYDGFSSSKRGNLQINAMLDYGKSVRAERQQKKDSLLALKSVKYQFKSISSKIVRAKTSTAARSAAAQAAREVFRLKRERMKDDVDVTEIDAAISHAKSMERVARRKVKHLLMEEMAEAGGSVAEFEEDEENVKKATDEECDDEDNAEELDSAISRVTEELAELSEEMINDISEELKEFTEDTLFGELNDTLGINIEDMEPEDIKMLKIKHRNSEMKEMVKADSEYLKAIFDHLEESMPIDSGNALMGDVAPTIDVAL